MGAVSAWRAHSPVSLLHSGCECDDLWSLRKGLKHAETGCGSANPPPPPPPPPPSTHTHNKHTSHTHMHIHTHHSISEDQQQRPLTRAFIKSQIVMAVGRGHRKVGLPGQLTAMHTGQQSRPLTAVVHQTNSVILMVASSRGHARGVSSQGT